MRLEVHQPMTEPFKGKTPTRIVVTEQEIREGENRNLQLENCSRLRLKMEIHPVSNSKYFHIALQLLFLTKSPPPCFIQDFGDENDSTTTDVVELLFLAESRRGSKQQDQSSQGCGPESSTTQSSPPLGDGALVEIAVGRQFFVIHVFAEHKAGDEDERVRHDQSLGLSHRVIVKVSKRNQEDGTGKGTPNKDKRKNSNVTTASPSQWLRNAFPPLRRVVTDDGETVGGRKLTVKPTQDAYQYLANDEPQQQPVESNRPNDTAENTSIPVCLQSWSVKSISSHGTMLPGSRDEICDDLSDSDAIIVAQGMEDVRVCRGVMFEI